MTKHVIHFSICYLILFSPVFAADALQEVMQALSKVERSDARYQEEKHLAMLDIPLKQTGNLNYIAPDQLIRSVDGPSGTRFVVSGDEVTLEKKGGKEVYDLNNLPMLKAFIASFGANPGRRSSQTTAIL